MEPEAGKTEIVMNRATDNWKARRLEKSILSVFYELPARSLTPANPLHLSWMSDREGSHSEVYLLHLPLVVDPEAHDGDVHPVRPDDRGSSPDLAQVFFLRSSLGVSFGVRSHFKT
jgi:hypothetical protein